MDAALGLGVMVGGEVTVGVGMGVEIGFGSGVKVGVAVGVATGLNFFSRNSSASATADFRATICVQERGRGGRLDGLRVSWKRSQGRRALFFCLFFQTKK